MDQLACNLARREVSNLLASGETSRFFSFPLEQIELQPESSKKLRNQPLSPKKTSNRFKEHLGFCLFHPGGVILIHLGGLLPGLIESGWWQLYRFTWDFGNAWHLVMASKRLDWSTMDVELLWRWEWWNFVDWWCFSVLFMAMLCFLLQGLHVCRTSKCFSRSWASESSCSKCWIVDEHTSALVFHLQASQPNLEVRWVCLELGLHVNQAT